MPDFTRVINLAYQRILGRIADPSGLDSYNRLMNGGLSEAEMRESLLRSAEYAQNNPGLGPLLTSTSARSTSKKKASGRKKKARRSR